MLWWSTWGEAMNYKRRKVMKALRKRGFQVEREGGGHTMIINDAGVSVAVPRKVELNRLTVRGIATDAGEDWRTFEKEIS